MHGADLKAKLLEALIKERDIKGTLHLIRHGFKFYGKTFQLAYFKPAHGLNQETIALFEKNKLWFFRDFNGYPGKDLILHNGSRWLF